MKKYIFVILACLSISFSSLIVEAAAATGEYSYDGMGRIVLEKNMVNNVNTLTQDMFYKGDPGSRVPNTNTIFVIQNDFVLAEDITIPDGCVLKFDGGSISGTHTLTGTNSGIHAGIIKILDANVNIAGTWNIAEAYPEWFGAKGDNTTDDSFPINKVCNLFPNIKLTKSYLIENPILLNNLGNLYVCISGGGTIRKKNNTTVNVDGIDINAVFALNIAAKIYDLSIVGNIKNDVKGIAFLRYSPHSILNNLHIISCFDGVCSINASYQIDINRVHCKNCENGINLSDNTEKTTITLINCWMENCGQAYNFKLLHYSSLINCAADWCNYVTDGNPYGQSFGNKKTDKGVYNFTNCDACNIIGCGLENCYGNGAVGLKSSFVSIDGLKVVNLKSEYEPPYNNYPNYAIGIICTNDGISQASIKNLQASRFFNKYVDDNFPTKKKAVIANNCSYTSYYYPNKISFTLENWNYYADGHSLDTFGGHGYRLDSKSCKEITKDLYDYNNVVYGTYKSKILSSNTEKSNLIIPIKAQGNMNQVGMMEIIGMSNKYNENVPSGFRVLIAFSSLNSINHLSILEKSSSNITASVTGMNICIKLPVSYTNLRIEYRIIRTNMVDETNIALQ